MNINKKIEQIRRQPEHVRLRYVWGSVFASMIIIIIIWLMSIQTMFSQPQKANPAPEKLEELTEKLQNAKEAIPQISEGVNRIPVSEVVDEPTEQDYLQDTSGTSDAINQENYQPEDLNY